MRHTKVLIVISDGGDNASRHSLDQVIQDVQRTDTIIYTVGLFDDYDKDRNPKALRRIARVTGGEAFILEETSAVVRICQRIAEDIRNEYTIGYVPTRGNLDGGYRTINVRASARHHGKLSARTRQGCIAVPNHTVGGAK
jgi:Ca-activated chloride channel family protein